MADEGFSAHGVDPALERFGFTTHFSELFAPLAEDGFVPGRIWRVDRGLPLAHTAETTVRCEPAAHLGRTGGSGAERVAVGDWVALSQPPGHEWPLIEAILPRSSAFLRRDPGGLSEPQVVAANMDTVFVMHGLARELNVRRLERELVLAWDSGAQPVVILGKSDLADEDLDTVLKQAEAAAPGAPVHVVSSVTGGGVGELERYLGPGHTVALLGASGVGKSTLVNLLAGEELQATAEVRESDHKGRHTTVSRQMIVVRSGGIIIDTPGLRGLGLGDAAGGMAEAFSDIERIARECRFRDCAHADEPGCAVTRAVEDGSLDGRRLRSYRDLKGEAGPAPGSRSGLSRRAGSPAPPKRRGSRGS
jgi:ribosome biogenesis GTPase